MATTAPPALRTDGHRAPSVPAARRKRQLPLVVAGIVLVVGGALGFADAAAHLGSREQVLVVTRSLPAGARLSATDLRAAAVTTDAGIATLPAGTEATVLGRPLSVPVAAGVLLTSGDLGAASPAAPGADVVAVALAVGQYPPAVGPGDRVQVVPVASSQATTTAKATGAPVTATVLSLRTAPEGSGTAAVASLSVPATAADRVARWSAGGQASLVELGRGRGS